MIKKIIVGCVCAMMFMPAFAAVDKNAVARAEKYLNSITGLTGEFVQTRHAGAIDFRRTGFVFL